MKHILWHPTNPGDHKTHKREYFHNYFTSYSSVILQKTFKHFCLVLCCTFVLDIGTCNLVSENLEKILYSQNEVWESSIQDDVITCSLELHTI